MGIESDIRIGDWLIQPRLNRIVGLDEEHQVEPKVMGVLLRLARQPGAVVSRDELLSDVWRDTVVVETAVFRAVSELRRILGDDPKHPRIIDTVRKRGYRLIASVEHLEAVLDQGQGVAAPSSPPPRPNPWRLAALGAFVLILAATAAISFRATNITVASRSPSWPAPPMVVANSADLESAPALSPDGMGLAYVRGCIEADAEELWKIHVKLPGDSAPRLLNPGTVCEGSPAWSPDGNSIAFWRFGKEGDELAVVPILGGPARVLARAQAGVGPGVSWSADGRWMAAAWRATRGGPMVIHQVGTGGEVVPLTRPPDDWFGDVYPAVSPDGATVAFVRSSVGGEGQDIYLVSTPGISTPGVSAPSASTPAVEPRRLTFDRKAIRGLAWRDDEHLVFSSKRSYEYALWQVSVETGELKWTGVAEARYPSFARHDDVLVYEHVEREINIWQANIATGVVRPKPLIQSTRIERAPHFRRDGKAVAFSSDRTGHFEIWTSDPDGGNPRQVTKLRHAVTRPRWSPDDRRLAFAGDVDGNPDIYVIDAPGFAPRRLTQDPATDQAPSWSSDGRWIYFASVRSGVWQIWKMASGGGEAVQVTRDGGFTAYASDDGQWLYYSRSTHGGLWRMPADGGDAERVLEGFPHPILSGWDVVGNRVVYALSRGEKVDLIAYDPEHKSATTLIELPPGAGYELTFSEDLTSVLFTMLDRRASDIYQVRLSGP